MKGKYAALWYGGCNYASPDPERDLEYFDSLRDAGHTLQAREDNSDGRTPCAGEGDGSEMHLYSGGEYHENGPDYILTIGPRGGVRQERG